MNWMVRRRDSARLAADGATLMAGIVILDFYRAVKDVKIETRVREKIKMEKNADRAITDDAGNHSPNSGGQQNPTVGRGESGKGGKRGTNRSDVRGTYVSASALADYVFFVLSFVFGQYVL